jgi:hypothetical protein
MRVPDPLDDDEADVVVDDAAAGVLADDALDDDDDDDPHPAITVAIMATANTPAPMRARLYLNIGPTPPLDLPACRSALTLRPAARSKPVRPACSKSPPLKHYAIRIVVFAIWIADDQRNIATIWLALDVRRTTGHGR